MTHPLTEAYDEQEDERLLKLLRFHSGWDQQSDIKIARILRQAANRIEELKGKETDNG